MVGVWKIEDSCECVPMSNSIPRKWRKNVAMAVEVITLLDLVKAVEHNMKENAEGKIITCTDCCKV